MQRFAGYQEFLAEYLASLAGRLRRQENAFDEPTATSAAVRTDTGTYGTLGKLLKGASADPAATAALALPANVVGGAFVAADGRHDVALWAKGASGEAATATYALAATGTITAYAWDYSATGRSTTVTPSGGTASLAPPFFVRPSVEAPPVRPLGPRRDREQERSLFEGRLHEPFRELAYGVDRSNQVVQLIAEADGLPVSHRSEEQGRSSRCALSLVLGEDVPFDLVDERAKEFLIVTVERDGTPNGPTMERLRCTVRLRRAHRTVPE
jgi:hypothetical protein